MSKRLFIIFHGRFPSERAAALYAAEHAKSLAAHMPTTLLVPRRLGRAALPPGTLPASVRVVYEVHDFPEHFLWVYAMLFRRVRFVLATNEWKRGELNKKFGVPEQKIIMERNGVDVAQFAPQDRSQARQSLGLP